MRQSILSLFAFLLFSIPAGAERVEPVFVREGIGIKATAAPPHLADREPPLAVLAEARNAASEQIAAIREWNHAGKRPPRNGFTRSIGHVMGVRIAPSEVRAKPGVGYLTITDRRTVVWAGSIRVAEAHRLRIHLKNAVIPSVATFWVHGNSGNAVAFGDELIDDRHELYTPSVDGDLIHLEVELPVGDSSASFDIADVVELLAPTAVQDSPTCLIDATCITSSSLDVVDLYRKAVAELEFVRAGSSYLCTGGLLNDGDDSGFVPYLLTANHCFSTQASAASLEAYWDYRTATCGGAFPSIAASPRSNGSTLLATSPTSDFTLVRMNSVPPGRALLGWDTGPLTPGQVLYRLSHPFPDLYTQPAPQTYSTSSVTASSPTCSGLSRPQFIYSVARNGGTYGGSSGSPVILSGGYTVGQLYGVCGPEPSAGCNASNLTVDGAFAETYPLVSAYLGGGNVGGTCTPGSTTLCLNNGRFRVTATFRTPQGQSGNAAAVPDTTDTGTFWFFSPTNIEVIIKVVNGCGFNSRYWVFAGGLTNVQVILTVVDTTNGTTRVYTNSQGTAFQPIQDTNAFATCP